MSYPIKIVCCVVDVHNVTMYREDGETITIPQGDTRLKDLVAKMVPAFEPQGPQFYMLTEEDMSDRNSFAETEKKMGGVARFFKMVKSKAKELLEKFVEPIAPVVLGTTEKPEPVEQPVPVPAAPTPVVADLEQDEVVELTPEGQRPLTKSAAAVAEIMANAVPSNTSGFSNEDAKGEEETTVIAVLDDNTIIPGCEALAQQALAVSSGVSSGDAMANFLRRAGSIKRGHSVEDLLKFIQKGELPLADDGSVLVYKLLNSTSEEGVFVDCHSGNVKQRVGSMVHMAERLVDPDRGQDCSNGLHVARRDYLSSFSGNVCVLAKLAPEDVIAVPQYDARKLRAKAYHIIARLSDSDRNRVKSNKPMEDQILLGNAVAGNHAPILEYVEITAARGGGLVVTPAGEVVAAAVVIDSKLKSSSLDHLATENSPGAVVDARALALDLANGKDKTVAVTVEDGQVTRVEELVQAPPGGMNVSAPVEPVEEATPVPPLMEALTGVKAPQAKTPAQKLADDFEYSNKLSDAQALVDFKKKSKKSWTALGIPAAVFDRALEVVNGLKPSPVEEPAPAPVVKAAKPKPVAKPVAKPVKAKASTPSAKPATTPKVVKLTQQEQMAKLVEIYNRNPDKQNAKEIVAFKQKAKKSWDVLGVTDAKFIKKITERAKL